MASELKELNVNIMTGNILEASVLQAVVYLVNLADETGVELTMEMVPVVSGIPKEFVIENAGTSLRLRCTFKGEAPDILVVQKRLEENCNG